MADAYARSVHSKIVLVTALAVLLFASDAVAQPGVSISEQNVVTQVEHGQVVPTPNPLRHVPDELLVRIKPGRNAAAVAGVLASVRTRAIRRFRAVEHLYHLKLAPGVTLQQALRALRRHPDVLYAEPNYQVEAFATPNDPSFPSQWSLANTGQTGGTPGADIGAIGAWDLTVGSSDVVVAVIDTGVDYTHPDLAANIWTNPIDCNGDGIDNDGNGYVDDCHGINALTGSGNPMDDNNHGTHVAGTIGALGNNGYGVAGVAWNVKIVACKFLDASGSGDTAGAIACLDYLAALKDRGVNIVASNNSWGGGLFSQALADAIAAQQQRGILFITAAGNSTADNDSLRTYPCSYEQSNIVCVAATDDRDGLASFSNYGRTTVHLGAPGVNILSTTIGSSFQSFSGTSMATPHVTGVAALLYAQNPSQDWRIVKNLLLAGGEARPSLANTVTGRRLDALGSLTCTGSPVVSRLKPTRSLITIGAGGSLVVSALNINCGSPAEPVTVTVSPTGEVLTLLDDGLGSDQTADDGVYTAAWTTPSGGGSFDLSFPDGSVVHVQVSTQLKPGFPVQAFAGPGSYQAGAAIHVLVGNIDADPNLEVLVTGLASGPLYAWKADGSPVPGWPALDPTGPAYPALGQLSLSEPGLEVVSGHIGFPGKIGAHAGSGAALPGWPRSSANYIAFPPSVASIDGSGLDTIFTEEEDWKLHAYRADGTILPGWPATTFVGGQRRHTPAIADLDGDGIPEIVTTSEQVSPGGVYLLAYHRDGTLVNGFPVAFNGHVNSFPVIGDVDGDGQLEIIVAGHVGAGDGVYIFSTNGTLKRTMQASGTVPYGAALALADLDGDGIPEIIFQTESAVNVWRGDGTVFPGWPVQLGSNLWLKNGGPVVGDIDGDGQPDIVVLALQNSSNAGDVLAFRANGTLVPGFPIHLDGLGGGAVPVIADIDLDGRNDLIVASDFWNGVSGYYDKVWAFSLGGPTPYGPIQWGQFMGGPSHDGRYRVAQSNTAMLGVTRQGLGTGTVTSSPAGIDCGADCSEVYAKGTSVTLTAAAGSGSTFTGWGGACAGQNNPCTITMDVSRSVTAIFDVPMTLTVSLAGSGTGAVTSVPAGVSCGTDCTEDYPGGTVVTLTATPSAGSLFNFWSGACSGPSRTCTVTMDSAKSVTAVFAPGATLSVSIAGSSSGTVRSSPAGIDCGTDCSETYPFGSNVVLTASGSGVVFDSWSGDCAGQGNPCGLAMSVDRSVTANFTALYTLSVTRGGTGTGSVTSSPTGITCGADCSEPYRSGTVVTLTATPDAGYSFTGWTGAACAGQGSTCTLTMTANTSVGAVFASIYTLSVSISSTNPGGGTVTSSPAGIDCGSDCSEPYPAGTTVTLTATSAPGFMFEGWNSPCSGQGTCTVTVNANQTIVARFRNLYTVSVAVAGSGTGTVASSPSGIACPGDCSEPYPSGSAVTLTATPAAGSVFTGWTANCAGQGNPCSLPAIGSDTFITANFTRRVTLTVTLAGVGTGGVSSNPVGISCGTDCSETYDAGMSVTLTAIAGSGSLFMGWSGACTGSACSITMNADTAAVATFAPNQPDLLETAVSNPPAAALPAGTFSVTDTVLNQGGVTAGASTTRYYLSLDTVKDNGDRLLSGTRAVPALAFGATSTGTVTVTIPSGTPLGTYYLLACADNLTKVTESNEANNCLAADSPIQVTRPDLAETTLSAPPATVVRGTGFAVTDTVLNQAAVPSGASTTRYYLSANTVKDGNDRQIGSRSVPALDAQGTSTGTVTLTVPSNMQVGTYYLLACADSGSNVTETDETNNCLASNTTVQVTTP